MLAKIIYFNWYKGDVAGKMLPTITGELLTDRPDLYDHVVDLDLPPDEIGCDMAFRKLNRVEEGDMEGLKIRSMSVGDVVLFDNAKMFVCAGCGWNEIVQGLVGPGIDKLAFWALPKVEEQEVSAETRIARGS